MDWGQVCLTCLVMAGLRQEDKLNFVNILQACASGLLIHCTAVKQVIHRSLKSWERTLCFFTDPTTLDILSSAENNCISR